MMTWELIYRAGDQPANRSRHEERGQALTALVDYFVDAGITVGDDPTVVARNTGTGNFSAEFTAPDGTDIRYSVRWVRPTARYLSLAQFAQRIGVEPNSMSRYKLPRPDAVIGPINDDGTIPRGTSRGWLPETIDDWNDRRPGRGARTDLPGSGMNAPTSGPAPC